MGTLKLSTIDAVYLQNYLTLCEEVAAAGRQALDCTYDHGTDEERASPYEAKLVALNEEAVDLGVNPKVIRTEFVA